MEIIKESGMILIGMAIFFGLWLAVFRKLDPDDFRRARYRNSRWESGADMTNRDRGGPTLISGER